jgi:hypothetical protein
MLTFFITNSSNTGSNSTEVDFLAANGASFYLVVMYCENSISC